MRVIGVMAVEHYTSGFESGGGKTNASKGGWRPRAGSSGGYGRAILVKSGNLKNDIQALRHSRNSVTVGTRAIPYAARHNSGLNGMPQREFIGDSQELFNKIEQYLDKMIIPKL